MNQKKQILISLIILSSIMTMSAQTVYIPNGAGGIGNNTNNSNVGIGTTTPKTNLDLKGNMNISPSINVANGLIGSIGFSPVNYPTINSSVSIAGFYEGNAWSNGSGLAFSTTSGPDITMQLPKERMRINKDGFVGIGTITPKTNLDLKGNMNISPSTNLANGLIGSIGFSPVNYPTINNSVSITGLYEGNDWSNGSGLAFSTTSGPDITMQLPKERMRINKDGFVGIGTVTPGYILDVCGTIRAKEIKVDLLGGCDFVFKKDYKLMSLNDLEKFVTTKQHLPEIASEKEMIENGLNMKEFQMKLLQKMEEMTLYIIEQNKKNEKQEQELKLLKAEIKKLKSTKR
jgi:hypothetical protein